MSDHKALTETEREQLTRSARELEGDIIEGRYVSVDGRLLIRAAEHIEVLNERIQSFSKAFRVIGKDRDRLLEGLGKIRDSAEVFIDDDSEYRRNVIALLDDLGI